MIESYPAKIKYIPEDKSYLVEFPDLPGCLTKGVTLGEAKRNAKEALTGYLTSLFERNLKIPASSDLKGKHVYSIEPEPEVALPILLKKLRKPGILPRAILPKCSGSPTRHISGSKSRGRVIRQLRRLSALQKFSIKTCAWNLRKRFSCICHGYETTYAKYYF